MPAGLPASKEGAPADQYSQSLLRLRPLSGTWRNIC